MIFIFRTITEDIFDKTLQTFIFSLAHFAKEMPIKEISFNCATLSKIIILWRKTTVDIYVKLGKQKN
jgi:hypothetical protein